MSVRVYEDEQPVESRWIIIFILLSLLAHALIILAIIIINRHIPAFKPAVPAASTPVSLTLVQPPPAQKRPFIPTDPQANVKPKDTIIESNTDANLQSKSQSRKPDSVMPDVVSKHPHASDMHESPKSPTKPQEAPPTPPAPKQPPVKQPQQAKEQQPAPTPAPPQPTQPPPPKPAPTTIKIPPKPEQQVDQNGFPVLPPLSAPTIAQASPNPAPQPVPPPMLPAEAADMQGKAGISGQPSPEAMATDMGRYKAKVYQAVGSRWYPKVNNAFSLLPVGSVRVQYTIYFDGTVTTKVLDPGGSNMEQLLSISINSITEAAPFPPFSDAMRKKVGDSYTDDFTFSVYGQ